LLGLATVVAILAFLELAALCRGLGAPLLTAPTAIATAAITVAAAWPGVSILPVLVATIHLSFVLPNAAVQLRRLRGLLPIGTPSVVVGDCNLWGPVAENLLTGWSRAVRGRTWPATRPHSQLDHLLVSPEVRATSSRVLGPVGSDHLPIQATLAVG